MNLEAEAVPLYGHAEALRSTDVDVDERNVRAVGNFLCTQRLDGREHRHHALLILDALQEVGADEERLDAFLHHLGHDARNEERSVLHVHRVLHRDALLFIWVVPIGPKDGIEASQIRNVGV